MQVYDSLIDQDPYFQQRLTDKAEEMAARKVEKVAAKRAAEKELQVLQQVALDAVEDRYPSLLELAREKIVLTRQADVLRLLVRQINKAPDEKTARWLLDTLSLQSDEE
jgi:hypothetical protein